MLQLSSSVQKIRPVRDEQNKEEEDEYAKKNGSFYKPTEKKGAGRRATFDLQIDEPSGASAGRPSSKLCVRVSERAGEAARGRQVPAKTRNSTQCQRKKAEGRAGGRAGGRLGSTHSTSPLLPSSCGFLRLVLSNSRQLINHSCVLITLPARQSNGFLFRRGGCCFGC